MMKKGKLSRVIPSHRKTIKFRSIRKDFLKMSDGYRKGRSRFRNKLDKCFWCGHPFENGEMIAIGFREKERNVVLCQSCADKALRKGTVDDDK